MVTLEERVQALESEVTRIKQQFPFSPSPLDSPKMPEAPLLTQEALRVEIERIRQETPSSPRPKPTAADFLERATGIFAHDPTFESVVRYSEQKREQERQEQEAEADRGQ